MTFSRSIHKKSMTINMFLGEKFYEKNTFMQSLKGGDTAFSKFHDSKSLKHNSMTFPGRRNPVFT